MAQSWRILDHLLPLHVSESLILIGQLVDVTYDVTSGQFAADRFTPIHRLCSRQELAQQRPQRLVERIDDRSCVVHFQELGPPILK